MNVTLGGSANGVEDDPDRCSTHDDTSSIVYRGPRQRRCPAQGRCERLLANKSTTGARVAGRITVVMRTRRPAMSLKREFGHTRATFAGRARARRTLHTVRVQQRLIPTDQTVDELDGLDGRD